MDFIILVYIYNILVNALGIDKLNFYTCDRKRKSCTMESSKLPINLNSFI